jgi:NTE family protein
MADFRSHVRSGIPEDPLKGGLEEQLALSAELNSLDDPFFPSRGSRVTPSVQWFTKAPGTEEAFGIARLQGTGAIPFQRNTLSLRLKGEASFGSTPPLLYLPTLGGPAELGAFGKNEFRARNTVYGDLTFRRSMGRLPDFVGGARYLVLGVEAGSAFDDLSSAQIHADIHAGLAFQTVLGPSQFDLFVGTGGSVRLQVNVGTLLH